jgi:hypothetical protein
MKKVFAILLSIFFAVGVYTWFGSTQRQSGTVENTGGLTAPPPVQTRPRPKALEGLLDGHTMLAVYGRGFGIAPILGRLGQYSGFDDMARDLGKRIAELDHRNGAKKVSVAVHLIYAMATPCTSNEDECLYYLEGPGGDLVRNYIEPAARRGWAVILDTQLGRSNPVAQVKRLIDKGYLRYDNVHVGLDPEFRAKAGQTRPGIPIGRVQASEINEVQEVLDAYVRSQELATRKIVLVHQFGDPAVADGVPDMIAAKDHLRRYDNVDVVIDMDGLGSPAVKTKKYNAVTDANRYPFIRYRGIKVFYPNRWEKHGHFDRPPMTIDQIMGQAPASDSFTVEHSPDVIIVA